MAPNGSSRNWPVKKGIAGQGHNQEDAAPTVEVKLLSFVLVGFLLSYCFRINEENT